MSDEAHDLGEATPFERSLIYRNQLLHVATEIYKAGVPKGRVSQHYSEEPFFTPKGAVMEALELFKEVDDHIVSCRVDAQSSEGVGPS